MKQIPSVMRAVVLTGHGDMDKLEYHDDWPTPIPSAYDVLIQVG
ncbi:MAG: alcohol dehydrogenase, partial [Gammaproteobacteria bacterium]|nr:alcohol dehydrogenase [Gammaproteobacteria bacterium]